MKFNLKKVLVIPAFLLFSFSMAFADGKYALQLTQVETDIKEVINVVKTSDKDKFEDIYEVIRNDVNSLKKAIEEEAATADKEFLDAVDGLLITLEKKQDELKVDLASTILEVSEGLSKFSSHMNKWKIALRNKIHEAAEDSEEAGEIALGTVILSVEALHKAGQEAEQAILAETQAAETRIEAFENQLIIKLNEAKKRGEDAWREIAQELIEDIQKSEGDAIEFAEAVRSDMEKAELALEEEAAKFNAFTANIGNYLRKSARMIGHEARHDTGSIFEWIGIKLQDEGKSIQAEEDQIDSLVSAIAI